jgi:hypothetical protein
VSPQTLSLSFAGFCNMPEERRRHFESLALARIILKYYDEIMDQFQKECHFTVYSQRQSEGDVYVGVYNNVPGGDNEVHLTSSEGAVLALVRTSRRSAIPKLATRAARTASRALKQRADR